ncbi:ABC transporter G family member 20-like [Apis cerana]|uniref:ABC transporter G family member 20-like n=1 Tax=Apis cerana TaxID=7461 RepID=UPI0007E2B7DF|nr:ABC transporter G family member 20-like [Apis cerana]
MVQYAIVVKNARKAYGEKAVILNNLNLSVPSNTIYGLLGASGCGKSTLLSCIVGVKKLDSGQITVLGGEPGSKSSGIPGPRVGYMPQDIALVDEFSAINSFHFFGRINGLGSEEIENRFLELKDLLQLPPRDRLIKQMSGGQQRRVSLGVALLHKPELLILDEPTVGLDPLLCENIWNHLVEITKMGTTVIITTHYIEETKQSNTIGLLRGGQLLAQSSPTELLTRFQTDSLEEAFLNLSQQQSQNPQVSTISSFEQSTIQSTEEMHEVMTLSGDREFKRILKSSWQSRMYALLLKNIFQFIRNPGGILFALLLPMIQIITFFNGIGGDPKDLKIFVVNEEAGNCDGGRILGNITYDDYEKNCYFTDISCRFIKGINNTVLEKMFYENYTQAELEIPDFSSVGIMYFEKNFSFALEERIKDPLSMPDNLISVSQIHIGLYNPNRQINLFAQRKLYDDFLTEYQNILKECGIEKKYGKAPIKFENPVYGTLEPHYELFVFPTYILIMLHIVATAYSSTIIISDRHSGVWNRILVQGVKTAEVLFTHMIWQCFIIVLQVTFMLLLTFLEYDTHCEGSIIVVIFMTLFAGIAGMAAGFFISVVTNNQSLACYMSVGTTYPLTLLSGLIWPIEAMPMGLRWFGLSMPVTMPGISLRKVMQKGISIDKPEIFTGFFVIIGWILGLLMFSLFLLKKKM